MEDSHTRYSKRLVSTTIVTVLCHHCHSVEVTMFVYIHSLLSCLASPDGQMNGCTVSQCSGCVGMAIDARAARGAVSDKFKFSLSWRACICFGKHIENKSITII